MQTVHNDAENVRSFTSETEAWKWLSLTVDDLCEDNHRMAYLDNDVGMQSYREKKAVGCCGFHDELIEINGRRAMIGCNYGH